MTRNETLYKILDLMRELSEKWDDDAVVNYPKCLGCFNDLISNMGNIEFREFLKTDKIWRKDKATGESKKVDLMHLCELGFSKSEVHEEMFENGTTLENDFAIYTVEKIEVPKE